MIITIDGPTASGKSTIARLVAHELGYYYINSGLLFRAIAYIFIHDYQKSEDDLQIIPYDQIISGVKSKMHYFYDKQTAAHIVYNDVDITDQLKTPEIDRAASIIGKNPAVRQFLLEFQRYIADHHHVVGEGRDAGTVVFPAAKYKFFITADLNVRAQRWQADQAKRGAECTLQQARDLIAERDHRDQTRTIAPLKPATDAIIIDSSYLTQQQVVDLILTHMRADTGHA